MKYHIYALGNALVDLEFEVTETELETLNVSKGVMTLIDEHRHNQLIDDLNGFKHSKASGGSAANSVIAAQVLGAKTFFSCRVANDENGEFYYQDLYQRGTVTNLDQNNSQEGITGKCIVMVTPDAERSMSTFLGITTTLSTQDLNEEAIRQSHFLYTEGYLVTDASPFATALRAHELAKAYHIKRVTTLSDPNIVLYFKENIKTVLQDPVDLLFCNEQEALLFCETDSIEIAKECLQQYAKTFAITLGGKGSLTFDGKQFHHSACAAVKVVDTLGAGDTFAGAFMYALAHHFSYAEANRLANIAAGKLVSKYGPRIDTQDAAFILNQFSINL